MVKIQDFIGLRSKTKVALTYKRQYGDNQYVFEFDAGTTHWKPGEHGIFTLPDKRITGKKWRAFSIASIPEHGLIRIATRITDKSSSFKQHLKDLMIGETIAVRGPFGWFYRKDEHTPMVMVAAGVGITPVMAMVDQQAYDPTDAPMYVIYAAPVEHLFRNKLDSAASKNPNIMIEYVHNSKDANALLEKQLLKYGNTAYYYVSGAPDTIKNLKTKIKCTGISGTRIIADAYLGY